MNARHLYAIEESLKQQKNLPLGLAMRNLKALATAGDAEGGLVGSYQAKRAWASRKELEGPVA